MRPPYVGLIIGLVLILLASMVVAAATGTIRLPLGDVLRTLLAHLGLPVAGPGGLVERVVIGVRLPRILIAACAGAALAAAGSFLSGSLRNPLAEPVTAGTAGGALLGASVVLVAGSLTGAYIIGAAETIAAVGLRMLAASIFAYVATLAVVMAARRQGGRILSGPLLLAGLAVNAVVGAVAALLLFIGPNAQTAATLVVSWTFGGLLAQSGDAALLLLVLVLAVAAAALLFLARPLDLILAGEEEAAAGGLDVLRTRHKAMAAAALTTGAAVAAVGVIAFVGLLAPMALRHWTGPGHLRLVPAAALLGATILVAADAVGRTIAAPAEVPAGVVVAALGAPVLLLALVRRPEGVTG